jgi:hypothetical protein
LAAADAAALASLKITADDAMEFFDNLAREKDKLPKEGGGAPEADGPEDTATEATTDAADAATSAAAAASDATLILAGPAAAIALLADCVLMHPQCAFDFDHANQTGTTGASNEDDGGGGSRGHAAAHTPHMHGRLLSCAACTTDVAWTADAAAASNIAVAPPRARASAGASRRKWAMMRREVLQAADEDVGWSPDEQTGTPITRVPVCKIRHNRGCALRF